MDARSVVGMRVTRRAEHFLPAVFLGIAIGTAACGSLRRDSCTRPRGFKQFNLPPVATEQERSAARVLPPHVQAAVNIYILKNYLYDPRIGPDEAVRRLVDRSDPRLAPIVAVRDTGKYLLLHVQNITALSSDFFLVYSKDRDCVVGQFAWYLQQ